MKDRGKRVAKSGARRPWTVGSNWGALKVRNILPLSPVITLSELRNGARIDQGDARRFGYALAPGFPIPRLWRCSLAKQTL